MATDDSDNAQREQLKKLQAWQRKVQLLSDTELYPGAVSFLQKLVDEEEFSALPNSQVAGLFSVSLSPKYSDLYDFVKHQRDRNWPESKRDIKTFYTALERYLAEMHRRCLRDDFHLLEGERDARQAANEIMVLLAREFIQHLLAENGLLALRVRPRRSR